MIRSQNAAFRDERKLTPPRFLAVDFFCGAGGTTCGLIGAGGFVVAGIDKDERVGKTYRDNNRNRRFDRSYPEFLNLDIFPVQDEYPQGEQDLLFEKLDELLSRAKKKMPGLPLLFAVCAPCQPFTKLSKKPLTENRQIGRTKDRGLLTEALNFIRAYKPDYVLSENVAGIADPRYGGIWQTFTEGLEKLGHVTGSQVVDACNFGVAQYRKRSILLAAKKSNIQDGVKPPSKLVVPASKPRAKLVSVRDAISHFPKMAAGQQHKEIPNHKTRSLSDLNKLRISVAKPGQSNLYMEATKHGDLSLHCHRKVNKKLKVRCFTDVYTRMHPDRPSPTITTKCHSISNGRFGHFEMRQQRGISLREAAALQSFPDNYVFYPNNLIDPVARMIGNAVPPKLARFFADYLISGKAVSASTAASS